MFRARASGFLVGFGTAGVLAAYQLRQDIVKSHEATLKQADEYRKGLEKRVVALEATVAALVASAEAQSTGAAAAAAAAPAAEVVAPADS